MSSIIADGVLAATHKLVQQAMTGQWQLVPKTVQERRELLNNLSASASPQDRQWLGALQQAMAESDAAVAKIAPADVVTHLDSTAQTQGTAANGALDTPDSAAVDSMMELLRQSR
jgi:recombinational DNA repair ATPase RecF